MIKRPMKGEAIDDFSQVIFPKWGSYKLDGFRCVLGEHPLTSRLTRFPNEHFHRTMSGLLLPGHMLDSEVVVGRRRGKGVLGRTSSGVTSKDGEPDFRLWVFDRPGALGGWLDRYHEAWGIVTALEHPRIKILKHRLLKNAAEAEEFLEEALELEYEGVILRDEHGPYKEGKATVKQGWMAKVKPFEDSEGRVIGFFEEEENLNEAQREATGKLKRSSAKSGKKAKGTLGGLILKDIKSSVTVRVGGGFTKEERTELWKIRDQLMDKLVRYKSQKMGMKDKPRHPGFKEFVDFRPIWDMTDD